METHLKPLARVCNFREPLSAMLPSVDGFRAEHQRFVEALDKADGLESDALLTALKTIRDAVLTHFRAKDEFYPSLAEHLAAAGDSAGAQLARIFEQNMKIQSSAVQRYFEALDRVPAQTSIDGYRTVASVIRQRFQTEERAVFPLTSRKEPRGKR